MPPLHATMLSSIELQVPVRCRNITMLIFLY